MFGFPGTTCNVPAIMRGGFRVTGSIGGAAGIGSKGTGVTSPKISRAKALEKFSRSRAAQEAAREENWI
jgi:hypothetical protein